MGASALGLKVSVLDMIACAKIGSCDDVADGSSDTFVKGKRHSLDEVDGIWQRFGWTLSALWVVRLHADRQRRSRSRSLHERRLTS